MSSSKRNIEWTGEELTAIQKHYRNGGVNAVMKVLPHRSKGSIACKAQALGIKCAAQSRPKRNKPNCKWKPHEIEIMNEHYAKLGPAKIQALLPGRSRQSIKSRANTMHLMKVAPIKVELPKLFLECQMIQRVIPALGAKPIQVNAPRWVFELAEAA